MKLVYTTRNGRFQAELEGSTQTELIERLAEFQEIFEGLECTYNGKRSDKVNFRVREIEGNKYYEAVCVDEDLDIKNARLSFGVHKKGGGVFPKRKNDDDSWNKNNGWKKYNKASGKEE